jgi:hypothetical protein
VRLNVLNLVDKNTNQLHDVISAAGTNIHLFCSWVHRTRFNSRSTAQKIGRIIEGPLHAGYSSAIKAELRNKLELERATVDSCDAILATLNYTPPERVHLTKQSIEDMFMESIREEERAQFREEFGA